MPDGGAFIKISDIAPPLPPLEEPVPEPPRGNNLGAAFACGLIWFFVSCWRRPEALQWMDIPLSVQMLASTTAALKTTCYSEWKSASFVCNVAKSSAKALVLSGQAAALCFGIHMIPEKHPSNLERFFGVAASVPAPDLPARQTFRLPPSKPREHRP